MRNISILLFLVCLAQAMKAQDYDLKLLSEGDGISSVVVYSIDQDQNGYLWLGTSYGLNRYDGHKFKQYYTSDGLLGNHIKQVHVDVEGLLWIKSDEGIQSYNGHDFVQISSQDSTISSYFNESSKRAFDTFQNIPFEFDIVDTLSYKDRLYVATYGEGLWTYDEGLWTKIDDKFFFDRSINDLFIDRDDNLWIASNYGLTLLSESEFQKVPFDSIRSSFEMIEYDNALWIGGRFGVDKIGPNKSEKYSLEAGANFILCMGVNYEGKLQAAGIGGKLYEWDGKDFIVQPEFKEFLKGAYVYDIEVHNKQTYYACGDRVLVANADSLVEFDLGENISMCYDIQADGNRLWFATSEGLILYADRTISLFDSRSGMTDHKGRVIEVDDYGNVWFGTYTEGLIQYDGESFKTYNKSKGLNNEMIKSIQYDVNEKCVWVGTNEGLHRLNLNSSGIVENVEMYAQPTGYPFLYCHNKALLIRNDGSLLFAVNTNDETHEEHLYSFNSEGFVRERNSPDVFIESYKVWNQDYTTDTQLRNWEVLAQNHEFDYRENDINFQFGAIHFTEGDYIQYQWYLEGYEENWRLLSKEGHATYTNLTYGDYVLHLRAKVPASDWCETKTYSFSIVPPFWRKWWFNVMAISLALGLVYMLITLRQRYLHKKQIEELNQLKQKAELELKALRAQFNPHFVFNVLNSIQSIILEQDDKNAILYLGDFSMLMRMTLNYSREKVISLRDELDFLKLYINLEQMRFETPFDFDLEIGEEVDVSNLKIPPLILQPYVENAIKHGLFNKVNNESRRLEVSFEVKEEKLKCIIKDNGIGRRKANQKKNKSHNSKGLVMMQERIDYLNLAYETKRFAHHITDVLNDKGEVNGTQIIIYIPTNL